jgi:hypothetical protein
MNNILPEDVVTLMEQFIRDMTQLDCAVFGVVYKTDPEPGIGLMRNIPGDPIHTLDTLRTIIKVAQEDGRIEDQHVRPLN